MTKSSDSLNGDSDSERTLTSKIDVIPATPVCEYHPGADFRGDVQVPNDLPTQAEIDRCANLFVLGADGESRPFKNLHSGPGVARRQLIIFVRHFFCGNCQQYLQALTSSITPDDLLSLPTPTFITIIGCGRPELINAYTAQTKCAFPIYVDPSRRLYDTLNMTRTFELGSKPEYIQKSTVNSVAQSIFQAVKSGSSALKGGDIQQVGGEFLFEDGKVVWCHRMKSTRDHAEIKDLRSILGLEEEIKPIKKRWSDAVMSLGRKRSGSWGSKTSVLSVSATSGAERRGNSSEQRRSHESTSSRISPTTKAKDFS